MGLILDIYRGGYDSDLNSFYGKERVTVVNLDGPFAPTESAPAAYLTKNSLGDPIIVPAEDVKGTIGPMFGGTFAHTSDSRMRVGFYGAVPIHDRYETPALYRALST